MRKALRDWWQSKGRSGGELCPAGERHDRAFECLPSDQPLIQSDLLRGVPLSGLKGLADSADWQRSFDPAGRGAGEWRSFHGRALLDREFVRVSKQNIRRLMDRWPAMVRSAGRFSCVPRSVDDESRSASRMLCLMSLSDGLPFEEISSVCAATIAKETAAPVLCVKLKVCSAPAIDDILVPAAGVGNVFVQRA
jgi:hypothetical protein